ncbi:hypothetical protein [Halomicronema hongdechloris]|nr:hypothetical protein [Halomicronema hongdechloris]
MSIRSGPCWLRTAHRYLAVMHGRSHIRDMQRLIRGLNLKLQGLPQLPASQAETPFEGYTNALILAFFQQYLTPMAAPSSYLRASYAAHLSQPPCDLWLIGPASGQALAERLQALDLSLVTELMEFTAAAADDIEKTGG